MSKSNRAVRGISGYVNLGFPVPAGPGPSRRRSARRSRAPVGFQVVGSDGYQVDGVATIVERMRARLGDAPVYVSVDIDVLDSAHAPGTGTSDACIPTDLNPDGVRGATCTLTTTVLVAPGQRQAMAVMSPSSK
jgi:arginase family protein